MPKKLPAQKQCSKCKTSYPATLKHFSSHSRMKGGLNSQCKVCTRATSKSYNAANPEKHRAGNKRWYANNSVAIRKASAEWKANNPEKRRATHQAWLAKRLLYSVWNAMVSRCTNNKHHAFRYYVGAKDRVTVCSRWLGSYEHFAEDLGIRPVGTSLGRDSDLGNYSCGQCRECKRNGWVRNGFWHMPQQQGEQKRKKNALKKLQQAA